MSIWDMMTNEAIAFWARHQNKVMLVLAGLIVAVLLSGCTEDTRPRLDSGKIVQVVKHDEVKVKDNVCTKSVTQTTKVNGVKKTKKVCKAYKEVVVEVTPETYDFELVKGNKRGWVLGVAEDPGESYQKGDQYP